MQIPSNQNCFKLLRQLEMMDHILDHSLQVCRVAMCIVDHLKKGAKYPNRNLVRAAALLHDITKTRSFKTGENHASTGGRLLEDLGYPEVGDVIRQHVRLDTYSNSNHVIEAEIVNYADKRVVHNQVVSLVSRLEYVWGRYGKTSKDQERLMWLQEKTKSLECKLFQHLPFTPEDLPRHLSPPIPLPRDLEE